MNHSKKTVFRSALDFEGRSLAICLEKIAEQNQVLRVVQTALPPSIAEHAEHCVISAGRLLIYTGSSAWASQIRFFQQAILNKLQESGQQKIVTVQVKVFPPLTESKSSRTARLPASETVQAMLGQAEEDSDDVLKQALSKLAKTLRKRLEK